MGDLDEGEMREKSLSEALLDDAQLSMIQLYRGAPCLF